jgi:hypothetical protein
VAHQYKCLEPEIDKDIYDLLAQSLPNQDADHVQKVAKQVRMLCRGRIVSLLKYSKCGPRDSAESGMLQPSALLGDDFVDVAVDDDKESEDFCEVGPSFTLPYTSHNSLLQSQHVEVGNGLQHAPDRLEDHHPITAPMLTHAKEAAGENPQMVDYARSAVQYQEVYPWSGPSQISVCYLHYYLER